MQARIRICFFLNVHGIDVKTVRKETGAYMSEDTVDEVPSQALSRAIVYGNGCGIVLAYRS